MSLDGVVPGETPAPGGFPGAPGMREAPAGPISPENSMDLDGLVRALRAPGTAEELSRTESTVAAMREAHAATAVAAAVVVPMRGVRRPGVVAAGAALGALALVACAGTAAAAFSGALPADLQKVAHDVLGAPAPTHSSDDASESSDSSSTSASGPVGPAVGTDAAALFGLCRAFVDQASDAPQVGSVAYRVLSAAAIKAGTSVEGYCDDVLASRSARPSGKPTTVPTPSRKPTAAHTPDQRPTTPAGRPSDLGTTAARAGRR